VTAGTIFQDTRKPLRLWFHAIWQVVSQKNGASARSVQASLGLASYRTAWTWLHKLRRAMVLPGRLLLSGDVEVDETFVGGPHPDSLGRFENKQSVVIAAEKKGQGIGRIRLACTPDTSRKSLHGFIQQNVAVGSAVTTDGSIAYRGLDQLNYHHQPIVLLRKEKDAASQLLPRVHVVASLLKRWLLGTHHGRIGEAQLPYYLDEFTFRFNRRKARTPGKLFHALLHQAVREDPAPLRRSHRQNHPNHNRWWLVESKAYLLRACMRCEKRCRKKGEIAEIARRCAARRWLNLLRHQLY
jgi:transposase-like protein